MRDNRSGKALTETSLLILLAFRQETHGYGAKIVIEERTGGRVKLGMGTLYGAINNMLEKGWIREVSRSSGKINYRITPHGEEQVVRERHRLVELLHLIGSDNGVAR